MNRLQSRPEHHPGPPQGTAALLETLGTLHHAPRFFADACTVFAPLHYEPKYAYPLLVWLHGPEGNERQLKRVMPLVSMRNYVGVAPRGTRRVAGHQHTFEWRQSDEHIASAEQRVLDAVTWAEHRFHIAGHRIFLAGLGCGGTMALRLALDNPDAFAGACSIGGPLPQGARPLKRLHDARHLALLLATSRDSAQYPVARVARDLRLLHTAGIGVMVRQYPCGDELTTCMLSDLDGWIMDQLAATAAICRDAVFKPD